MSKNEQPNFYCNLCDVNCITKFNWNRHLLTAKHIKATNETTLATNLEQKEQNYICKNCNKIYKNRSGLWRHNKKCFEINTIEKNSKNNELVVIEKQNNILEPTIIYNLVKQITESNEQILKSQINETSKNSLELQKDMFTQIIELLKTNLSNTTNNIITNNNNNYTQFNLQVYLNETCKNAMNIDKFLDYLEPTVEELEATAYLGYVEGISRIIMRGFKNLEEEELPFHCTDLKREHIYVKNPDDEWVEEKDEKPILLRFIKEVARKSFNNINEWKKKNPNWTNYHSKQNDMFMKILNNSVSGGTEEEQQANYEKIMKNIMKNITIDKSKKNSK